MNLQGAIRRLVQTIGTLLTGSLIALVAVTAPGLAASPDQAPPLSAGAARVWFLRELNPGTAMHAPMLYANGAPLTFISEGTVFYRDFPPGTYAFAVENCSPGSNRSLTIPLDAGNDFALRVQQDDLGPLDCGPTFYLSVPSPDMLTSLFAPLAYRGPR